MSINYHHDKNLHSLSAPSIALPIILKEISAKSILDIGCGTGTWLKAALDMGIHDVLGIDGCPISEQSLLISHDKFVQHDLTQPITLNRRFDLTICLEVAEHLDASYSDAFIAFLTSHSDVVLFSAACPGQPGESHINCQWPDYWQSLFNKHGFVCDDDVRWKFWNEERIESWYRQNAFLARKNPELAGSEPRLAQVIHPSLCAEVSREESFARWAKLYSDGYMPVNVYFKNLVSALSKKVLRALSL